MHNLGSDKPYSQPTIYVFSSSLLISFQNSSIFSRISFQCTSGQWLSEAFGMNVEYSNLVNAPATLDAKFFQDVLENGLLDVGVTTKRISFEMGSGGGDNYCSQIYRVRVSFTRETSERLEDISVIVKNIPLSDVFQFLEVLKVFFKEKVFYYHILPRMEILLDNVKFGTKLYHTIKEPIKSLVFEDLSALGYIMANREVLLDLNHCKFVMKKLGQFHGISMIMHKKDPTCMNAFQTGILTPEVVNTSDVYDALFGKNIQGLLEIISKWKSYESITEKVKKYAADFKANLIKSQQSIPGELRVLNHGDLWVNNLMFKYKNGSRHQLEDVLFVDLQMSIFGSPGYDINYFLFTSVQLDVLKVKRDELLRTYHTAICETLKAHNYKDIPTFDVILTEVRRRERYGFFANFGIFPRVVMDKDMSGDNSIETFLDEDCVKKKIEIMFSSKRLVETMKYTLTRFDELGILD